MMDIIGNEMVIILRIVVLLMIIVGVLLLFMNHEKFLLLGGALAMYGVMGLSVLTFVEKEFLNINREKEEIINYIIELKPSLVRKELELQEEEILERVLKKLKVEKVSEVSQNFAEEKQTIKGIGILNIDY